MNTMESAQIQVGTTVETKHGVQAQVLKVEQRPSKKKKGVVIEEPETWLIINNGPHNTWVALKDIKGVVNG
jgi:hypothetical protein